MVAVVFVVAFVAMSNAELVARGTPTKDKRETKGAKKRRKQRRESNPGPAGFHVTRKRVVPLGLGRRRRGRWAFSHMNAPVTQRRCAHRIPRRRTFSTLDVWGNVEMTTTVRAAPPRHDFPSVSDLRRTNFGVEWCFETVKK